MKYKIPIDSKEEEKTIGGVLTLKQFAWIATGFVTGLCMFAIIFATTQNTFSAIILTIIPILITLPFSFLRIHDMTLFKYLQVKKQFLQKTKKLYNIKGGE